MSALRKGDLDILTAACMTWMPSDAAPEVSDAFARLLTAFDEAHAGEDAPGNEPPKVIVVTEASGRQRRYEGDEWQAEEAIDIVRKGEVIVTYPPGHWTRAAFEGAELDGVKPKAERLQSALRQIAMADEGTPSDILQRIARAELERSGWDEEDL